MSYQLKIDKRSLKTAKFVSRLQGMIQKALIDVGMTQQEVAQKLGVDRSVINRRLKSKSNLTARSISDFAFALDRDIKIEFVDLAKPEGRNWSVSSATPSATLPLSQHSNSNPTPVTTSPRPSNLKGFERLVA